MPTSDAEEREALLLKLTTDLRAALETVELERRRLAAVLEALPVGVAIADSSGKVTHFNAALTRIWGRPPVSGSSEEYRGWRGRWVGTDKELQADDWAMVRALRTGEVVQGDMVDIEKLDGSGRATIVNAAAPIKDTHGRVLGGVVAEMDVTAQHRTEQALRQSEALYRAVVENTTAIVLRVDVEGVVRFANQRALDFFGYTHEELVGQPALGTILPESDTAGRSLATMVSDISGDLARFHSNSNENMRKGGERVWVEWTNSGIYDDEGRLVEFLSVGIDATERKRAEEALVAANARLTEADRRKDEFLAMLGHELRNPLAVIAGAVHLMASADADDEVFQKARAAAERQSEHMSRLVDELLDVSRITEGKVILKREPLDLTDVIESAVEAARPLVEARGHRLFLSVGREPLRLVGDPVRLAQAVGNLVNNAAKYTPVCGEIQLFAERRGAEAAVVVRDNGIGISPDLLPRVFDLFVQGERGPDRSQGGLGIGLTLARRLVEMHGGRLTATSKGPGQGSQFTISLPLAPAPSRTVELPAPAAAPVPPRRRILVVDDNADGAEMLTLQLQLEGHEAQAVYDGAAALKIAAEYRPDVVILDIGMPGMDGYEVARRMRQDPAHAGRVLIALTGYGQEEDIEASRRAGFDHHLVKPVAAEELRRAIQ